MIGLCMYFDCVNRNKKCKKCCFLPRKKPSNYERNDSNEIIKKEDNLPKL